MRLIHWVHRNYQTLIMVGFFVGVVAIQVGWDIAKTRAVWSCGLG